MVELKQLAERLRAAALPQTHAVVGFDAVVDCISRPIRMERRGVREYFSTIGEFGAFIAAKQGLSGTVSIERETMKLGGNMPILSNCLGTLGILTDCIGTFGTPSIAPVFAKMSRQCILHSVGEANTCTALEFEDGKLMLADMTTAGELTWDTVLSRVGLGTITRMYRKARLIGLVNWSELKNATGLWRGLYEDVICQLKSTAEQYVCVDITDFTCRAPDEVTELLELLRRYIERCRVIITLNENEARLLYRTLLEAEPPEDVRTMGDALYVRLHPEVLVIHPLRDAHAWSRNGYHHADGFFAPKPLISTGAGDHFNGGLCFGLLLGLSVEESLTLGGAVSGYYVRSGKSPSREQLAEFLEGDLE